MDKKKVWLCNWTVWSQINKDGSLKDMTSKHFTALTNQTLNTQKWRSALTFDPELRVGSGVGCWEVNASCHVHTDVVEDQHVSGSVLLDLNILREMRTRAENVSAVDEVLRQQTRVKETIINCKVWQSEFVNLLEWSLGCWPWTTLQTTEHMKLLTIRLFCKSLKVQ